MFTLFTSMAPFYFKSQGFTENWRWKSFLNVKNVIGRRLRYKYLHPTDFPIMNIFIFNSVGFTSRSFIYHGNLFLICRSTCLAPESSQLWAYATSLTFSQNRTSLTGILEAHLVWKQYFNIFYSSQYFITLHTFFSCNLSHFHSPFPLLCLYLLRWCRTNKALIFLRGRWFSTLIFDIFEVL